jgi:predicted AlkP superfamily phosphohydrolase/phosphomutase
MRPSEYLSQPKRCGIATLVLLACVLALWADRHADGQVSQAYIGPGAGIAVLGSFLAVLLAMLSALGVMVRWPIMWVWRTVRGRRALAHAKVKRVVVVGLDGLEPTLTEQFLDQGLLPNLELLRQSGTFRRLGTTCPPLSPVAWSSFSTGTNPGKHGIFDFIARNPADYQPRISSVRIEPGQRSVRLGPFVLPLSRPTITALRKSKPFWVVLGEAGVFSAVLRVPITFPPDKFHGVLLSAMSVPDLRGSQGTFTSFSEITPEADSDLFANHVPIQRLGNTVQAYLPGPANSFQADRRQTQLPLKIVKKANGDVHLFIGSERIVLPIGAFTPWVNVAFRLAPGLKVHGICRFLLASFDPPFQMYCTPVQIDPRKPVMPISHPPVYATYLASLLGPFATLGIAEDTSALSQGVLTEAQFLTQTYDIHDERQAMLHDALRRVRRGMVTCVFDAPDRIQHMFWRFIDANHPAAGDHTEPHQHAIRDMYVKMDQTVGKVMAKLDDQTALFVISDHGFKPFRRGVDLNAWLLANGYLFLKDGKSSSNADYLTDVDWSRTKAYALGLAGIYINQAQREGSGIVQAGRQKDELIVELTEKLTGLIDPDTGQVAIHEAIPREKAYAGPYVDAACDLIVGYDVGYRVSWHAAVGKTGTQVFSDNTKPWSGDHCLHASRVPGVLFSNRRLPDAEANIIDLAPTVLELLGVPIPAYMDGRSLLCVDVPS